jgi:hypothetical protein
MIFRLFGLQFNLNSAECEFVCASVCACVLVYLCVCNHKLYLSAEVRCRMQHNFTRANERTDLSSRVFNNCFVMCYIINFLQNILS